MNIKPMIKAIAALAVSGMMLSASANSVGFTDIDYDAGAGTVSITVAYDFTDFAMFGGGIDITWDSNILAFGSYTQAELAADAQAPASPLGAFDGANSYVGAGVGTFDFFVGMNSAGNIGTIVLNVIAPSAGAFGGAGCGFDLCLGGNAINPFVSLAGATVTDELLANGNSEVNLNLAPIPVPAAVWFMLSGLGALVGFGRKSA